MYAAAGREGEAAQNLAQAVKIFAKAAAKLNISVRTVETHLSKVFAKLGTHFRVGLAAQSRR